MVSRVLFSSARGDWRTPTKLYEALDQEFHFTFDPCPVVETEFQLRVDGLTTSWAGETVFMNPPYGFLIGQWVQKAHKEEATVVCLLPARTDTAWFHDYCLKADEIRFIRRRLHFDGAKNPAPFPSMIVIFRRKKP